MKTSKRRFLSAMTLILLAATLMLVGCYSTSDKDDWFAETVDGGIEDAAIDQIEVGMTFSKIVELIGKPQRDTGTDSFCFEWDMRSGKILKICFNSVDKEDVTLRFPYNLKADNIKVVEG